ncbi:hypothetical protein COMA2_130086 [Candidatus Nitrospira nitrificans]|uniref:Uncharacterized protein n=1 Tax=Candidatus Nitrospira nitrificans TaxID=1742973 RepID=A0A0S4LC65_9BACT|nr:hypothetical protein COMA2_130086 [Candidatus Nitrospira nitrificans]
MPGFLPISDPSSLLPLIISADKALAEGADQIPVPQLILTQSFCCTMQGYGRPYIKAPFCWIASVISSFTQAEHFPTTLLYQQKIYSNIDF